LRQDFCSQDDHGGAVHRCIHAVSHLIEDHARKADLPLRFSACKVIEGDELILDRLQLEPDEKKMLDHIVAQMERERGLDRSAAMADMRFSYIHRVCEECVKKPHESKEHIRSQKIDRLLTGKYTAIPVFIGIMGLVFYLTFNVVGAWLQDLLAAGIANLGALVETGMESVNVNIIIQKFILEGLFEGVGSVLSFLPVIVIMFFFLSMLEDSGYIARVAFFMDKLLRRIGLSGRSIVPLLIGFGCTVPAVMSTRTLPSERDRKMTILLTPFMSCTAKLPIFGFFTAAFFPGKGALIMMFLYVLGIVTGILAAFLFKKTMFQGEAVPFVMELPNYRLPSLKNVLQLLWEKAKDFLQRAFSVILIATIIVWFLKSFDFSLNLVTDSHDSILAAVSGFLVPILRPIGLGDWRIGTSLISGFMAKEGVVSMMQMLFGTEEGIAAALSGLTAFTLMVFSLLYTPCVAAVASIRRELGRAWAVSLVVWQCAIAWAAAFIVRLIGLILGLG
ncbi:MAG: ferrous iron transport protein B, partial [Blautia sp.]|nr:ferrous iron transport protein B [Blautia sp.]